MDESTDLTERLVRLETWAQYERERTDYLIADLSRRLQALERAPASIPLPVGSAVKIALAILLPLAVLAATGDIKVALRALGG